MLNHSNEIPFELTELERIGCSLVIFHNGNEPLVRTGRGVADLYELYESGLRFNGDVIADKVVGKGAAVMMVALGFARCLTPVASRSAVEVLENNGIDVVALKVVDNIINRAGTGRCPVEELLDGYNDIPVMIERIKSFLDSRK